MSSELNTGSPISGKAFEAGDYNDNFKCPSCGADMKPDSSSKTLTCVICNRKDELASLNKDTEDFDFARAEADATLNDWGTDVKAVKCGSCGIKVVAPSSETAACAFCGSSEVTVLAESPGIRPDLVIPFRVDLTGAIALFAQWIKKRRLAPLALKNEYRAGNIRGVYIPYWSFDSISHSSYTGQAGDYYYDDETSTVTVNGMTEAKTKRVQKIKWRFVSGSYDRAFKDIMFNDSAIDPKVLESLEPFRLNDLVRYDARFLSGFSAERYASGLGALWQRTKRFMGDAIRSDIKDIVKRGCDVSGKINISTDYKDIKYRLMMLPVWISSYRFRSETYNFFINGQTGEVQGKSPKSFLKIGGAAFILLAVIAGLYFILRK